MDNNTKAAVMADAITTAASSLGYYTVEANDVGKTVDVILWKLILKRAEELGLRYEDGACAAEMFELATVVGELVAEDVQDWFMEEEEIDAGNARAAMRN